MANVKRIDKIREAGSDELHAQQKELSEQIFRLRFQLTTGQAEALKRLRDSKKDLARVKTLIRAQELNAAPRDAKTSVHSRAVASSHVAGAAKKSASTRLRSHSKGKA
jgi:large subunit ribosomal protein L29